MRRCELESGELIKRIHDQMEKVANNKLQSMGITFSQMKMLVVLRDFQDETATLKELEKYFDVAQATAAGIAIRLEKKGFVASFIDSNDRRIKHISLTDKGRELCEKLHEVMAENEEQLLSPLSLDERSELKRLLTLIYEGK